MMDTILRCCGWWMVFPVVMVLWFGWLHHKGQLIEEVPDAVKDLF